MDHRGIFIKSTAVRLICTTSHYNIQPMTRLTNILASRSTVQPTAARANLKACSLDPYTHENRQALILDQRVDRYLCSRPDAVKYHSQKLPRFPCNNPAKRKLRKPVIIRVSHSLTLQLVGVLGSGSFAHVFSASVVDTASSTACSKAVKVAVFVCGFYLQHMFDSALV